MRQPMEFCKSFSTKLWNVYYDKNNSSAKISVSVTVKIAQLGPLEERGRERLPGFSSTIPSYSSEDAICVCPEQTTSQFSDFAL